SSGDQRWPDRAAQRLRAVSKSETAPAARGRTLFAGDPASRPRILSVAQDVPRSSQRPYVSTCETRGSARNDLDPPWPTGKMRAVGHPPSSEASMRLRTTLVATVILSSATLWAADYLTHGVDPGRTG